MLVYVVVGFRLFFYNLLWYNDIDTDEDGAAEMGLFRRRV